MTFDGITPDAKSYWLDQSNSGFEELLPLANRETKLAKTGADEQAVFGLFHGRSTNRDEWVYDFDPENLASKGFAFFADIYEESRVRRTGGRKTTAPDTLKSNGVDATSNGNSANLDKPSCLTMPVRIDNAAIIVHS